MRLGLPAERRARGQLVRVLEHGPNRAVEERARVALVDGVLPFDQVVLRPRLPTAPPLARVPVHRAPMQRAPVEREAEEEEEEEEDDDDTFTPPSWLHIERRGRAPLQRRCGESELAEAAFKFKPTANQTDFGPRLRKAWHAMIKEAFKLNIADVTSTIATELGVSTAAAAKNVRFFSPAERPSKITLTDANVLWKALPTSFGPPLRDAPQEAR